MGSNDDSNGDKTVAHPATQIEKIALGIVLLVVLLALLWAWKTTLGAADDFFHRETRTRWDPGAKVSLKPGPPNFRYDETKKELIYVGAIDQKVKLELIDLFPVAMREKVPEGETSYWSAVDKLAYESNDKLSGLIISVLLLGGLSGALGVQLRSLVNFVGNACITGKLDVITWWPYYASRPFIGFLLGGSLITMIQAGHFAVSGGAPTGALGWASLAFLAGFGDDEVTQRLRLVTKTLFGGKDRN